MSTYQLSKEGTQTLVDLIANPPEPTEKLIELMRGSDSPMESKKPPASGSQK